MFEVSRVFANPSEFHAKLVTANYLVSTGFVPRLSEVGFLGGRTKRFTPLCAPRLQPYLMLPGDALVSELDLPLGLCDQRRLVRHGLFSARVEIPALAVLIQQLRSERRLKVFDLPARSLTGDAGAS